MADSKSLTKRVSGQPARQAEEQFRIPAVDIYETNESVVLLADMPGVTEKGVEVSVEEDMLSIIGRTEPPPSPERASPVYAEYATAPFRRVFALSGDVKRDGIEGKIKNGVLRLTIPKAEEARVRKIPISAPGPNGR